MRMPESEIPAKHPELERLRVHCLYVAVTLFADDEIAAQEVDATFREMPEAMRRCTDRRVVEAWLIGEVVRRARRHERDTAEGRHKRGVAIASTGLPSPLWQLMHTRGELEPLLRQLPAAQAEAFTLRYLEKATLNEMMQRTGASAGVVTHRIAEATRKLHALTDSLSKSA